MKYVYKLYSNPMLHYFLSGFSRSIFSARVYRVVLGFCNLCCNYWKVTFPVFVHCSNNDRDKLQYIETIMSHPLEWQFEGENTLLKVQYQMHVVMKINKYQSWLTAGACGKVGLKSSCADTSWHAIAVILADGIACSTVVGTGAIGSQLPILSVCERTISSDNSFTIHELVSWLARYHRP